jgi:hypothetical protein
MNAHHLPGKPWVAKCRHIWSPEPLWDWYIESSQDVEPKAMRRVHCTRCAVTHLYIGMDPSSYPLDPSTPVPTEGFRFDTLQRFVAHCEEQGYMYNPVLTMLEALIEGRPWQNLRDATDSEPTS